MLTLSKSNEMVDERSSSVNGAQDVQTTSTLQPQYKVACDERCPVVHGLASMLQHWDTRNAFVFVDRNSPQEEARQLISELDRSNWSLLLVDNDGNKFEGPEAIPMILKTLSMGRIFVVLYCLPGTMLLTRLAYNLISQSRKRAGKLVTP